MKHLGKLLFWVVLCLSVVIFILPFWFMICNSFEEFSYVLPNPPHLFPSRISFAAYEHVLSQSSLPQAALNSVVITLLTAFFTVLVASLSAYGFARIDFFGREVLFRLYLFTLMLPGFLGIIPQFLVLQGIGTAQNGLIGTKAGLILLYVGAGICGNTFFLRGHMAALPKELEDAVKIDGGGHMTTFFRVMLPLALPSIGTHLGGILLRQGHSGRRSKPNHPAGHDPIPEGRSCHPLGMDLRRLDSGPDSHDRAVCGFPEALRGFRAGGGIGQSVKGGGTTVPWYYPHPWFCLLTCREKAFTVHFSSAAYRRSSPVIAVRHTQIFRVGMFRCGLYIFPTQKSSVVSYPRWTFEASHAARRSQAQLFVISRSRDGNALQKSVRHKAVDRRGDGLLGKTALPTQILLHQVAAILRHEIQNSRDVTERLYFTATL